jgi:signal transduction histidine kinase
MKPVKSFRATQITITILVIAIVSSCIGVFFYLDNVQRQQVEAALLEEEKLRQIQTTRALSQNIGSDLDTILTRLELLANSEYMQRGEFDDEELRRIMVEQKQRIDEITPVDYLLVNDKNGIRVGIVGATAHILGGDFSSREYFEVARETRQPVFSNGYFGDDGIYRMAITQPIINRDTGDYLGIVGTSMPTIQLFAHYGNVHDIGSQFLVAFDRDANILAAPSEDLVGENFFGEQVQSSFSDNDQQIQDYRDLFQGKSSSSIGDFGRGERIATREPVFVRDQPQYFITLSTPTATIYTQIDDLLFEGTLQLFIMIAAVLAGVLGLLAFTVRWNKSLNEGIKKRTEALDQSNRRLKELNEQLLIHDKLQKEFVNIAAHELRTPMQPLLAAAELIESQFNGQERIEVTKPEIEMILRNAKRLERLSSDILEISRIESGALKIVKERFSLAYIIAEAIKDSKMQSYFDPVKLAITYHPDDIFVNADRDKITQVVANLLMNSINFTKKGRITVTTSKIDNGKVAEITVRDTGPGIDPDIMPRIFEKFVTKSERGTGIGLYISKKIVEAHGGTISGSNNSDGPGATFTFTIPVAERLDQDVFVSSKAGQIDGVVLEQSSMDQDGPAGRQVQGKELDIRQPAGNRPQEGNGVLWQAQVQIQSTSTSNACQVSSFVPEWDCHVRPNQ